MAPTDSDLLLHRSGRVLLRRPEVLRRVGLKSPVTLWRWIEAGDFPAPVKLNPDGTLCAWHEDEVDAWVANRPRGQGKRPEAALEAHERYARERHDAAREAANIRQSAAQPRGSGHTPVAALRARGVKVAEHAEENTRAAETKANRFSRGPVAASLPKHTKRPNSSFRGGSS